MEMTKQQLIESGKALHDAEAKRKGGLLLGEQKALHDIEQSLAHDYDLFWSNEIKRYVVVG